MAKVKCMFFAVLAAVFCLTACSRVDDPVEVVSAVSGEYERPDDAETNSLEPDMAMMVPMRDGVRLATYVRLPEGEGPFPTVLTRSIYRDSIMGW